MSNWIHKLNLKDLWKAQEEGKLTTQELGKKVAKRIREAFFYKKYEKELMVIAHEFENIEDDVEEFDELLNDLYDWADFPLPTPPGEMQRKRCWVATRF